MSDTGTGGEPQRWEVPTIDGSSGKGYMTAARLQEIQQQAWDEAWQKGHEEGLRAGAEEVEKRVARIDELLQALARPFDRLDESVEKQLVELSMAVTRQLFRREIRMEPTHIIGVVREAIQLLPLASRNVQIHLHPDDAALIRDTLSPADGDLAWTIVEDPLTSHGGCRITTDNSQIDATAESRLNAVISGINGDERQ